MRPYGFCVCGVTLVMAFIFGGCSTCLKFQKINTKHYKPSNVVLLFGVDTCDDRPVPNLKAEQFVIREDGKKISVFESKQTILPRNKQFELVSILLLDLSGSIIKSGNLGPLQKAVKAFINQVSESQKVAIYAFDGSAKIHQLTDFTSNRLTMRQKVSSLSDWVVKDPSTNLNGAVVAALPLLDARVEAAKKRGMIASGTLILFTDGTDQAGRVSDAKAVTAARGSRQAIFSVGLGGEIDKVHLKAIGTSGWEFAKDSSEIVRAFETIAARIKAESNKYYALSYCSPKRSGRHEITLTVEGAGGQLQYSFDATGFSAGCNPRGVSERDISLSPQKPAPHITPTSQPAGKVAPSTQPGRTGSQAGDDENPTTNRDTSESPIRIQRPRAEQSTDQGSKRRTKTILGYSLLASGAALVAGGGVLLGVGSANRADAKKRYDEAGFGSVEEEQSKQDKGDAEGLMIAGAIIGGVGLAAAGVALWALLTRPANTNMVSLVPTSGGIGVQLNGVFW